MGITPSCPRTTPIAGRQLGRSKLTRRGRTHREPAQQVLRAAGLWLRLLRTGLWQQTGQRLRQSATRLARTGRRSAQRFCASGEFSQRAYPAPRSAPMRRSFGGYSAKPEHQADSICSAEATAQSIPTAAAKLPKALAAENIPSGGGHSSGQADGDIITWNGAAFPPADQAADDAGLSFPADAVSRPMLPRPESSELPRSTAHGQSAEPEARAQSRSRWQP